MRISVMGAGAVGCYYGGMLARAGHEVTLIAREQHVAAIQKNGLRLDTKTFQEDVEIGASTDVAAIADSELVLVCVKSADSEETAALMLPYLRHHAVVLSLQNGVDNAARLQAALNMPVVPAVVYVAAEMAGAGHVKHHGRGELVIATSPQSEALADLFRDAGIPMQVSDAVQGALWAKLIINCAFNALSAVSQLPYGDIFVTPGVPETIREVIAECQAVAKALGVTVPGDSWQTVVSIAETMPTQRSSTAQDMARGRKTEIDHLNGYIVREGDALGIPTPVNRTLLTLVKLLELSGTR